MEPDRTMTEAVSTCLICDSFLEFLKEVAWCKQGDGVLVAVNKCTPEIIVAFSDHEVKVYPGGTSVKLNKSWLAHLQEKNSEGTPINILMVWRPQGVELWYRRHLSWDYPYDAWSSPVAAAYETERVLLPAEHGGEKFKQYLKELGDKAKACPPQIPPQ
jgi:hypothetical protein